MKQCGLIRNKLVDTCSNHHKLGFKHFVISFRGGAASCCQAELRAMLTVMLTAMLTLTTSQALHVSCRLSDAVNDS